MVRAIDETEKEIACRVNVTLPPSVVEGLDKNVQRLQDMLVSMGADPKQVKREVSRSSLFREFAQLLATEAGYNLIKSSFCLVLGVQDNGQMDLFNR